MPTTVSTTPLSPADIQLLGECSAHGQCVNLVKQITQLQEQLTKAQARKTSSDAAYAAVMNTILTSKSVDIPNGAKVVRQTVNGVDSLLVQTP